MFFCPRKNRLSPLFNCPFLFFMRSSFLLTDITQCIHVKCTKDIFAKFLRSASWIELFVDFDELFLIQFSSRRILLQTIEKKTKDNVGDTMFVSRTTHTQIYLARAMLGGAKNMLSWWDGAADSTAVLSPLACIQAHSALFDMIKIRRSQTRYKYETKAPFTFISRPL